MFSFCIDKQMCLYYDGYTKGGKVMFYDMFLDEVFYFGEEEKPWSYNPNLLEGLNQYSKQEVKNFSNGKVSVLKKDKDLFKFIKISRNILSNNEKMYYGKIDNENANNILRFFPYDLKGFNVSLQMNAIKHIFKHHGNPIKEKMRGQIAINDNDYLLIPYIIRNFDKLKITNYSLRNKTLEFRKTHENVHYYLIAYVSFKNHSIEIKTFYKK